MNFRTLFFATLLAGLSLSALSQEKTLTGAQEAFAKLDRALNESYQKARATLPEHLFEQVREEQRNWIEYRDQRAATAARLDGGADEGKEKANPEYWNALAYLTETRIKILRAWTRVDQFSKSWEGVWTDGYGGHLLIAEDEAGNLTFTCSAVRGASYHNGHIAGTAKAYQSTARFSTTAEGEEKETWLTFLQEDDGRLRIIGENTEHFHGARAYFDGRYLRVRELTAEDRKEIADPGF
ncbi:MAG: DUF1311 domain-containing protein [Verrucomicrobiales bacterium]|nr:DUF1311 domain-containing protein [Verrucomicrobiales bacterium]